MFTEGDSESEEELMATPSTKSGYSQLQLEEENRDRSQSTGSEQIGRFEVRGNFSSLARQAPSPSLSLSVSNTKLLL